MSRKDKSRSNTEPAGWGLRLAALAFTLLIVVLVFVARFAGNGNEMGAIMWAGTPIFLGVIACVVLGLIKKLSSPKRQWQIYTYVMLLTAIVILVKTLVF